LGAPTNAVLGPTTVDTLTVVQSDPQPTVSFANAAQSVNENAGTISVTVKLSAASNVATTVAVPDTFLLINATTSPTVIPAGQTSAVITLNVIDDLRYNTTNTIQTLALGALTNALPGNVATETVTIIETDPKPTVTFAAAAQTVNENAGTFSLS